MTTKRFLLCALLIPILGGAVLRAGDLPALWAERVKCTVAVEYVTETELERHTTIAYGTVADDQGTIILPSAAIDLRVPSNRLKDFKIYRPNDLDGSPAVYLGRDPLTGWHFVRAAASIRSRLVPITAFMGKGPPREPALAEDVWGIALRNKDEDFTPYIMRSHVALVEELPQRTAIAQQEVAGPGLPVFDDEGRFLGIGASSFGQTFLQFSNLDRGGMPVMLVNVEESSAFLVAGEVIPNLGRIPRDASGRPLSWLGAYGLEPMDRDVAVFLKLAAQSGAVVSEVLEGSPAEKAGLKARDIILAIDGRPLPHFKPARVVVDYIDREIAARAPGATMTLSVLRGTSRLEVKAVLGEEPKLVREADRKYFEKLGFTAREFVYGDAVARHVATGAPTGFAVPFVKPNSPADIAGLKPDDWVKEIDGVEIKTFAEGVGKLSAIEGDPTRTEAVVLVSRGGDTAVLRIKLRSSGSRDNGRTAMFTGIVEETGRVEAFAPGPEAWRLTVAAGVILPGLADGDSVAVDGCCLTVVHRSGGQVQFDVLEETRRCTHFPGLRPGAKVNLERSLSMAGRIGGHFVTGHVDGVGAIEVMEARGKDHYLRVAGPPGSGRLVVAKGSVAMDGISLTVAEVSGDSFAVWLIPHTLAVTSLADRRVGGAVNLEFDLLAKYVEKLLGRSSA